LVKDLQGVETLGALNLLAMDMTGTLMCSQMNGHSSTVVCCHTYSITTICHPYSGDQ